MKRVAIIGAGECGVRAALALREQGFEGSIDLINGEPHTPYERPPLSKPNSDGVSLKSITGVADLDQKQITHHCGVEAKSIDRDLQRVVLSNDEIISYDCLLIATGAKPRPFSVGTMAAPNLHYLRTYDDAMRISDQLHQGRRLTIIGGGFIGLELAVQARLKEVRVTLIEVAPRLLGRAVPADIASLIEARHRAEGVEIFCGAGIAAIDANGTISLQDGNVIESDLIVAGIGSLPVTDIAAAAGLVLDNGIAVDGQLRTSDPLIFAAGDCCSFPHPLYDSKRIRIESWRAAQEQGEHAARAILGSVDDYQSVPWFWSDQYELGLQIAGLSNDSALTIRREMGENGFILFHLASDGRLLAASGIGPGNSVARDIRLAEMLIAKRAHPDPATLGDPAIKLKSLLAA